ncbi:unnamed protein product, partial [Rotaria sp. Silwood2]
DMGNKHGGGKSFSSTELTPAYIAILKANTKFSESEIRQWYVRFLRDCPTLKLDRKQFVTIYKQLYPHGKPDNFCKYAFDTFDTNGDGFIEFQEFLIAIRSTNQGNLDDHLAFFFDMYDTSDDGQINEKELTKLITAMYDLLGKFDRKYDKDPKKRAADIIAKIDVDGNKKISKQEFIDGCKNYPVIRWILAPNA